MLERIGTQNISATIPTDEEIQAFLYEDEDEVARLFNLAEFRDLREELHLSHRNRVFALQSFIPREGFPGGSARFSRVRLN